MNEIKTKNLILVACDLKHFEAILQDRHKLELLLDIVVPENWTEFPEAIKYAYEYLKANPSACGWWTYLFVHCQDRVLIGLGGFKGQANESGVVEIGYEIIPDYRNRGLATEAARGLIDYAFSHSQIKFIDAQTLPEANASTRVLEKIGLRYMETVQDRQHGAIWHWRLAREDDRK